MRAGLLIAILLAAAAAGGFAEDIPLMACDGLPMVQVSVAGMKFSFLLDTAATSTLNMASFRVGDPKNISVTSWNGTYSAHGQEVTISDLLIGEHHLRNLTLLAVDLSAIGRACGHSVDGILGIDLLRQLGAVVDLNNHVARLATDPEAAKSRAAEFDARLALCTRAFNTADDQAFSDCLDPRVVLFTSVGDFHGRDAFLDYLRREFGNQRSRPQLAIMPHAHHVFGERIWTEFELRINLGQEVLRTRGTLLCEKAGAVWRIVHLNSSAPPDEALALAGH